MFSRINIVDIILDHFKTLNRIDKVGHGMSFQDTCLFFILPIIISTILIFCHVGLESHITDLITSISIIGGFLFNLLAIVYGLMDKLLADANSAPDGNLKATFVKEIHTNISFNIILSLLILLLLLIHSFVDGPNVCLLGAYRFCYFESFYILNAISWVTYSLLGTFSLTMLMILNRIYILLKKD